MRGPGWSMAEQTEVEWPTCEQAGCIGIRLVAAWMCLAHASEEETAAALKLPAPHALRSHSMPGVSPPASTAEPAGSRASPRREESAAPTASSPTWPRLAM